MRHWALCFWLRNPAASASQTLSATSPKVGMSPALFRASIGLRPLAMILRASAAFSRTSASGTAFAAPRPISLAVPRHVKRRTHLREPVGETTK
jgi:hypothetical protein